MIEHTNEISIVFSLPNEALFQSFIPHATGSARFHFVPFDNTLPALDISGFFRPVTPPQSSGGEHRPDGFAINRNKLGACQTPATERENFLTSVRLARKKITESELDKVVISSVTKVAIGDDFAGFLADLKKRHPGAFVYAIYHPKIGAWMGATPEPLLRSEGMKAMTVSLAGTRMAENQVVPWGQKESLEQSIVTDYIKEKLRVSGAANIRIGRPETIRYGDIEHLRSLLNFETSQPLAVAEGLHPTPAVCGSPVNSAKKAISELETHQRAYYTGYVGISEENTRTELFVNLRCMQLFADCALVYTGGGITFESDPEDEWEETRNKLRALLAEKYEQI